jgi:hypothetical protein
LRAAIACGMARACRGSILNKERAMADKDGNRENQRGDRADGDQSSDSRFSPEHEKDNEWLRDQVGEDHNLSGSSTYRTLPDQPEGSEESRGDQPSRDDFGETGDSDVRKRQSNR